MSTDKKPREPAPANTEDQGAKLKPDKRVPVTITFDKRTWIRQTARTPERSHQKSGEDVARGTFKRKGNQMVDQKAKLP